MASYKRLVKVKARAARWKRLYKQCQKDNDALYAEYKWQAARVKELEGIVANLMPTGTVGGRIKALETTNEFLEGKTRYLEGQVAHHKRSWEESIKANDRLRDKIKAQEVLLKAAGKGMWHQEGPNTFVPAEINVIGREK